MICLLNKVTKAKCALAALIVAALLLSSTASSALGTTPKKVHKQQFDVVIAGGSTAAFAAALASAKSGARTALLEPTDWVGGQLTSSGVPAVDEAWHKITDKETGEPLLNVSQLARDPKNITPSFLKTLKGLSECGDCWVSRFCFRPQVYLEQQLLPLQEAVGDKLVVFHETVVKSVERDSSGKKILSLTAIQRTPRESLAARGYDRLPSADLAEWYSPDDSKRFTKTVLRFGKSTQQPPVFIEATEWGEVLALSGADYLQGVEIDETKPECLDTTGQSTVYCFVQEIHNTAQPQPEAGKEVKHLGYGDYQEKPKAWDLIWTYRRIGGAGPPEVGDLCLQNWGYSAKLGHGGNDYPFGYLFLSQQKTAESRGDWQGGINLESLAAAEERAYGWHHWFRQQAPEQFPAESISLAGEELGTGHGLAKLPYIRDTRRSIGLDGFVLQFESLTGPAANVTGEKFHDRIALGAYAADIHPLHDATLPEYLKAAHDTLPFHIPFRALTHHQFGNLLVAGKTMSQSFLANSATRLHPIEWSTGTAAGVVAAHMAKHGKTSREEYDSIEEIQQLVKEHTPIDWDLSKHESSNQK